MARRQAEKSAQTRSELKNAARRLFREKGYEETSVADIVEEAGYSVGAFYRHFDTKKDIASELFIELTNFVADKENAAAYQMDTIYEVLEYLLEQRCKSEAGKIQTELAMLYRATLFSEKYNSTAGPDPMTKAKQERMIGFFLKKIAPNLTDNQISTYASIISMLLMTYWIRQQWSRPDAAEVGMDRDVVRETMYLVVESCKRQSVQEYNRTENAPNHSTQEL